jgi:hypothetical protein
MCWRKERSQRGGHLLLLVTTAGCFFRPRRKLTVVNPRELRCICSGLQPEERSRVGLTSTIAHPCRLILTTTVSPAFRSLASAQSYKLSSMRCFYPLCISKNVGKVIGQCGSSLFPSAHQSFVLKEVCHATSSESLIVWFDFQENFWSFDIVYVYQALDYFVPRSPRVNSPRGPCRSARTPHALPHKWIILEIEHTL